MRQRKSPNYRAFFAVASSLNTREPIGSVVSRTGREGVRQTEYGYCDRIIPSFAIGRTPHPLRNFRRLLCRGVYDAAGRSPGSWGWICSPLSFPGSTINEMIETEWRNESIVTHLQWRDRAGVLTGFLYALCEHRADANEATAIASAAMKSRGCETSYRKKDGEAEYARAVIPSGFGHAILGRTPLQGIAMGSKRPSKLMEVLVASGETKDKATIKVEHELAADLGIWTPQAACNC